MGTLPSKIDWLVNKLHGSHHDWFRFQQFEIVELPTIYRLITKKENGKERTIEEKIFDKSSDRIARLIDRIWLCRYPHCRYLIAITGRSSNYTLKHSVSQPRLRIQKRMPFVSASIRSSEQWCAPLKYRPIQLNLLTLIHLLTKKHGHFAKHTTKY
jgi:hypothetical protein